MLQHEIAEKVRRAYKRIAEVDRPEVWITLRPEDDVLADAAAVDPTLPLAGMLVAVKDNVDVAGLPTTAACPEFAYTPEVTATAVARLVQQGALILGKTNLDQFATGLVGTRSPYGPVRCAWDPERVSGGSSSGSAAAVALGIVDIGIGTDTAGSGRVPAAFHGIVGIKTTLGIVPTTGVVPACADYDCVTVLASDLETATRATRVMTGYDASDPRSRTWPADVRLAASPTPRLAVPRAEDLAALSPEYREAFDRTLASLKGISYVEVDISVLLGAAVLLYDGAIVAQRYSAVGEFLSGEPESADPTVAQIVRNAAQPAAHRYVDELGVLASAKRTASELLDGFDGLLLPTTTEHPTIAAVQADPVGINRRLGTFTNFCNLLDMAAVAVPGAPTTEGHPFGVMVVVPGFADQVAVDVAARVSDCAATVLVDEGVDLLVVGAHLEGFPLHHQLTDRGARFVGEVRTSDAYRLVDLGTTPPKPGLVRHGSGLGAPIAGELYRMSAAGLGTFLAGLPAPMGLTSVELSDGRWVTGFGCSYEAGEAGVDITEFGGWRFAPVRGKS
ncbi:allophanate hydrolase [Rhodococcus sp. BP-252]|uniref:allophanate hydrolase n=1 Tax=unclassified Rhodococcus (in: high G+C Gram-positive bacteria) TaxID=192944 RepID=UPI001C9AF2CC|nr:MULTISPECIES: allophanate hydrolase [unclassified Rhodococcus (in: high G+C Gram-positive bacteria)]MBY6413464.1 allophanate hydrolase [Rhodococcus sp. BP-320]MBY6418158.1 allophanate hydrolase [Rhodococcus sp. BP-321]MBY6422361.1 allophanate hydrolase [Rhodococcus sp. BP-324]MBY6428658.1 allophanate hydrolase [Rhodococcus sp. BP-323]MBY6433664.1 allophanate hydrolase [Rhodococcus sp. BP-322]